MTTVEIDNLPCRCCKFPCRPFPDQLCVACDGSLIGHACAGMHGDELEGRLARHFAYLRGCTARGETPPPNGLNVWQGIALCALDDARTARRLMFALAKTTDGVSGFVAKIARPPHRWEVYLARRRLEGVMGDVQGLMGAVLAPFDRVRNTAETRGEVGRQAEAALRASDPLIVSVEVDVRRDPDDRDALVIEFCARRADVEDVLIDVESTARVQVEPSPSSVAVTPPRNPFDRGELAKA